MLTREKSQEEQVLDALKAGRTITPIEALTEFGCFRLGARIWDLKRQGHLIETVRFEGEHYVGYRLTILGDTYECLAETGDRTLQP